MEPLHAQHAYHHEGLRQRYDHDRHPLDHKVPPPTNTTGQPQQKVRLSPTQQTHIHAGNRQAGVLRHGTPPQGQLRSPPPQYQPHPHQAQQAQQQQHQNYPQQQQHQQHQQKQHQSHNHQQYTQHMLHPQQQPNGLSAPILLLLFVSFALYVAFVPWAGNPPAPAVSTMTAMTTTVGNVQKMQAANPQVNVNNHNIMREIAAVAGGGFQERSLAREGQMHNAHALHQGLRIPMEESRNVAGESRNWQETQSRREGNSGFNREVPEVRTDEYGVEMMKDGVGVFSGDSRQAVVMPPASVYSNAGQNAPHIHQPIQPLVPRAIPDESLMSVFMQQANIPQYVPSGPANGNTPPGFQPNGIPTRQQPQQPLQQLHQQPQQPHLPPHQQQPQYHHNGQEEQAVTPQKGKQYRGPDPPLHPSVSLPPLIQKQPETIFSSLTVTVTEQVPSETYQPRPLSEMSATEQTFIAIKPDGVQRGLIGPIISRFESRGFKLAAIKLVTPGKAHLEQHYADLAGKPFFNGLIEYMNSGPICAMVWEGRDAVKTGRTILGATNPLASAPGTIRGDYAIDVGRNVCHGSDSVENAKKEIALWFKEGDLISWKSSQFDWVYEKP